MREPELVAECVHAMRAQSVVPVTVKCRLGVDEFDSYEQFRAFIDIVAAAGCGVFLVHARKAWLKGLSPKENREKPPLWYDRVRRIKLERPELRIVLNGGVAELSTATEELTHVDGVMIGRAAYHNPWLLAQLELALFGTALPELEQVIQSMQTYVESVCARGGAARHVGRHLLGLFQGGPGAKTWRQELTFGAQPWAAYQAMRNKMLIHAA